MRDTTTGIVTCRRCGAVLGNYLSGDYYKLIRLSYCPDCKVAVRREQKRFWAADRRHSERELNKNIKEQNELLKQENAALRVALFGTDSTKKAMKMQELLQQLANE